MGRRILIIIKRKYALVISLLVIIRPVNVQFAMPMMQQMQQPPPPPMIAYAPPPPHIPPPVFAVTPPQIQVAVLPFGMAEAGPNTQPPQTTANVPPGDDEHRNDVAIAIPVPMPMQIAIPGLSPPRSCVRPGQPNCPPCPPCICAPCMPAFFAFCSPCHLKCRCRSADEAPVPLPPVAPIPAVGPAYPMPVPLPPNVVVVPVPPRIPRPHRPWRDSNRCVDSSSDSCSSSSEDSDDSCDSEDCDRRRGRKGRRRHRRPFRRFNRKRINMRRSQDDYIVEPQLSFVNSRGNVRIKTRISDEDVAQLIAEEKQYPESVQNVRLISDDSDKRRPQLLLVSEKSNKKKVVKKGIRRGKSRRQVKSLKNGKKEIVFKPPPNKQIKNLSVSFQVA